MRSQFPFVLIRVFVLASFGVIGSVVALVRYYRPHPPMVVPAPAPASSNVEIAPFSDDAGAMDRPGEISAPELLPTSVPSPGPRHSGE